ncbi:unnamed protein product [Paramecium sonneborni]|uniref:Uncharacterized protein n=1 Tax=Paramecium sonneborni TaxID=65129 RepID=A0A8S1PL25_9CILI|nr:unnamed protein product [Paramecium sonneborni]
MREIMNQYMKCMTQCCTKHISSYYKPKQTQLTKKTDKTQLHQHKGNTQPS